MCKCCEPLLFAAWQSPIQMGDCFVAKVRLLATLAPAASAGVTKWKLYIILPALLENKKDWQVTPVLQYFASTLYLPHPEFSGKGIGSAFSQPFLRRYPSRLSRPG